MPVGTVNAPSVVFFCAGFVTVVDVSGSVIADILNPAEYGVDPILL